VASPADATCVAGRRALLSDTVGALLLGSAVVRIAAVVAELDTRQPGCDADHTAG